jgi:hypothetical protein
MTTKQQVAQALQKMIVPARRYDWSISPNFLGGEPCAVMPSGGGKGSGERTDAKQHQPNLEKALATVAVADRPRGQQDRMASTRRDKHKTTRTIHSSRIPLL